MWKTEIDLKELQSLYEWVHLLELKMKRILDEAPRPAPEWEDLEPNGRGTDSLTYH